MGIGTKILRAFVGAIIVAYFYAGPSLAQQEIILRPEVQPPFVSNLAAASERDSADAASKNAKKDVATDLQQPVSRIPATVNMKCNAPYCMTAAIQLAQIQLQSDMISRIPPEQLATLYTLQSWCTYRKDDAVAKLCTKLQETVLNNKIAYLVAARESDAANLDAASKFGAANRAHTSEAFASQHTFSGISFWMVHGIVVISIGAALIEFAKSMRLAKESKQQTELKLQLSGLSVKSSLNGILILIASMGFYVLFLIYIYPIKYVQ